MKIIKQFLAVILGLISVVVFVSCIVVPIASWNVQPALHEGTTRTFTKANEALEIAGKSLTVADQGLRQAKEDLDMIKSSNLQAESEPIKPTLQQEWVSRFLVKKLGDKVHIVNETVSAVTDASIVLNSLMEGLNRLPDPALVGLNTDQLKQCQLNLAEIIKSSHELSGLIELGATDELGNLTVYLQTSVIDQVLNRIIQRLGEFREKVTALQIELTSVKTRTLHWIRVGPAIITGVSIWLAACQVSMFLLARAWFRRICKVKASRDLPH